MERQTLTFVVDENGLRHQLTKRLGQGGEGAVFRTADPNVIVKMKIDSVTGEPVVDEAEYEKYKAGLDEVRTLDLPEGIPIAKVASVLKKPYCGYTMRMLKNMRSVKHWIRSFGEPTVPPKFFRETGGLGYRLKFLSKAAGIFARLNYHSVVYADLSPDNLFVSGDNDTGEVWLIDADHMRYFFDVKRQVMTPGYEAPEILAGKRNSLESDEYTFAVLAHEILTLNSPFKGEMASGEENSWDGETAVRQETSAFQRKEAYIPWIYDPEDTRNAVSRGLGLDADLVMTNKMKELFYRNFCREGQENPSARPTMREWFEELRRARDLVITCEHCGNTYFMRSWKKESCPFCRKPRERDVFYAQLLDEYNLDAVLEAENKEIADFNEAGDFSVSMLSKEDFKPVTQIGKKFFDDAEGIYVFFNYQTDELPAFAAEEPSVRIGIANGTYEIYNCMAEKKLAVSSTTGACGEIAAGSFRRFDELNGLVLTTPVTYGRRAAGDGGGHGTDGGPSLRKRHIKFIRL